MIEERLSLLWNEEYVDNLPSIIKVRGYNFSVNSKQKDILITGINPSFRKDAEVGNQRFDFEQISINEKYDPYWSSLLRIIHDKSQAIDLRNKCAYLDIFYFRETDQNFLRKQILKNDYGVRFLADQLSITQRIIEEVIQPKLIIVKNKESADYWGKLADMDIIWMGYQLEIFETTPMGELYKIIDLLNENKRICPGINETRLKGSLILFTQHFRYASKEKIPTAIYVNNLIDSLMI